MIYNSNNNYTNGFMNNTSLIKMSCMALFPSKLVEDNGKLLTKIICRNIDICNRYGYDAENRWYRDNVIWPWARVFEVREENQKNPGDYHIKNFKDWLGGDISIRIPIKKKHRIKYLSIDNRQSKGFWMTGSTRSFILSTFKPLLNIYNENQ